MQNGFCSVHEKGSLVANITRTASDAGAAWRTDRLAVHRPGAGDRDEERPFPLRTKNRP